MKNFDGQNNSVKKRGTSILVKNKNAHVFFYWGVFFFLMIFKYGYYQFRYYPVMDDWIQYGTYSLSQNPFQEVVLRTGMYTVRPLAGLSDVYIIGKFWGNLGGAFLVITLMHAMSAYFFVQVLRFHKIKTGYVFLLLYGLLPFGSEATYWISASSRLVVSIFWLSLALFYMGKYIYEAQNKRHLFFFFLFQLLSLGYYETVVLLGFVSYLMVVLVAIKKKSAKILGGITLVNFYIIAIYYNLFSDQGQLVTRGKVVEGEVLGSYSQTFWNIVEMLKSGDIYFYIRGFSRGLDVIVKDRDLIFLGALLLVGVGAYFASKGTSVDRGMARNSKKILLGFILFMAPFLLFFIIGFHWISYRNAFTSFIGLGLIIEGLVDLATPNLFVRRLKDVLVGILAVVFVVINVSEITDFRATSLADEKIAANVLEASQELGFLEGERQAILFNAKRAYVPLNKEYNEHINSITSSDWLLTGTLRGVAKNVDTEGITPVFVNTPFELLPKEYENYIFLGIEDDLTVYRLTTQRQGNYVYHLFTDEGDAFGKIEYRYGYAFFSKQ
jgi:hypothetical protein